MAAWAREEENAQGAAEEADKVEVVPGVTLRCFRVVFKEKSESPKIFRASPSKGEKMPC